MSIPYSLRLPNLANLLLVLSRRELSIEQKLNADLARLHDNFPPSFVDRLPYADRGTIAAEDGQCPICLTAYGEDRGDGTTEEPTLLPCRHVIGRRCLEKFLCVQNTRPQDYEADFITKCMLCRQTLFDYGFQWFVTKGAFSGPHVAAYKRAHDLNDKEVSERFMAAGLCFAKGWGWFWKLHRVVGPPLMASEAKKFSSDRLNDEALQTLAEDNLDCLQLLQKWIGTAKKPLDEVLATAIHQVVEKE